MTTNDWIEEQVLAYEKRVYGEGEMPEHNKSVLRQKLREEDKFWMGRWVHEELQAKHGEDRHR